MKRRCLFALSLCAIALCASAALVSCSSGEAYAPEGKDPVIAVPTIGKEGVLRVGVNAENPPLAGTSEATERIVGIDVDMAASLADELGLSLEIIDVGTNPASALEQGTVDIVMGIDASNTDAAVWKSDEYLPTATALFSLSSSAPAQGQTPKIAAAISSESSWAVTNAYGSSALVSANTLTGVFDMLVAGEVPYAAADAVNGLYAVHANDVGAQIVALFEKPSGYCIGVLEQNTALKQAVSDALDAVTSGGIASVVQAKWLGESINLNGYSVISSTAATNATNAEKTAENQDSTS